MPSSAAIQPQNNQVKGPETHRNQALTYALITPARNEAAFIEQTIKAVIAQSQPPLKWVIVSDGSTDGTDEIVKRHSAQHPWIELVRMPERHERHFAGKVYAFKAGYDKMAGLEYDIIGNLDADITFDAEYFAFLLSKFAENPRLGVAGTPYREGSTQYDYRFTSIEHVSGACQLFRRECFKEIGGYTPIKTGGIDLVAVISARMHGWQTRSFPEKTSFHHRNIGTANHKEHKEISAAFHGGWTDYTHGCDPVWQLCRSIYQMSRHPILLNGICCLAGYVCAMTSRAERVVAPEMIQFRKHEQRRRLRKFVSECLHVDGPREQSASSNL